MNGQTDADNGAASIAQPRASPRNAVGAFLAAFAVSIYVALTDSPDRQASSGMYVFGDSLLFLAVFGLAAETAAFAYFVLALVHRS